MSEFVHSEHTESVPHLPLTIEMNSTAMCGFLTQYKAVGRDLLTTTPLF